MKTKPIIAMLIIFVLVLFGSFLILTLETSSHQSATTKYAVCCRNADGFCVDLFESPSDRCGENNIFVSEEFCYKGEVPKCEKGSCFVDGVLQRVEMNYFECEKFHLDAGASTWSWEQS